MKNLFLILALVAFLIGNAQEKSGKTKTENNQRIKSDVSSNRTIEPNKETKEKSGGKKAEKKSKK